MMRVNAHAGDRTDEVDHVVGLDAAGGSHGLSTSSGAVRALPQALGYVRVSTQGQFDEQHLARQIEKVLAHAKRRGLEITLIFQEVVHGALTSREDRPALHNCLDEALARGCQIVATSPSRLTRSSAHAHQLYDQHPDRFDFVEPLNGYADKPWHLEVADCHASFPDHTSTGTIIAMDKSRAAGKKYGAGDGGVAGRAAAGKVIKANKQARVERMADILAGHPSWQTLTRAEAGKLFSDAGVHPPHSSISSSVPWTKDTITRPFRAAKELLAARNHIVQTIPLQSPANAAALPSGGVQRPMSPEAGNLQVTSATADHDPQSLPVEKGQSTEPSASSHGVAIGQVSVGPRASMPSEIGFQDDVRGDDSEAVEVEPWTKNPLWGRF
jgi:hypothetical protein